MLSVPLPFLAGLAFALTLHDGLKGVDVPGTRRYFHAFLLLYALQGIGVGLRFGYGVDGLSRLLPVTAALMPPLAFLAFRGLAGQRLNRPWLHLAPAAAVAVASTLYRNLVDPLLLVIFFGYGLAIWRMTLSSPGEAGGDVMAEASLPRMRPALRAARLTAGLMLFFAISDAALAVYTSYAGTQDVPFVVTIMNIAAFAAVAVYYFLPQTSRPRVSVQPRAMVPSVADEAVVARVKAALEDGALYRDEGLSLAKLARKAGLPAREVSAAINRATGLNVSQFVNNRRVAEACRLLVEQKSTVTQVMLDAGFSTKSNFNREFRRVMGKTPAQYRAENRAGEESRSRKSRA
ncbi:AraC family transcriptional regulator [Rhizobium deserti]|uniref:AraC family transcriptional regulator n=1 Tax=Rhizobium deserti TaxID=2547961 RepID=A0A4V3APA3_9HYPH|nr:AraC family transcriptional regulator [Rhizobium deserti]TDK35328.1 AraC family transcriptional regulator [Rhizobium deserti]